MGSKASQPLPEPSAPYDENVPGIRPLQLFPLPPPKKEEHITITQTENGFVVTTPHFSGERTSMVFEQREGDDCMVKALISALYDVIESLGCVGSKYDTCRIRVLCQNEENEDA